jgi:hypothetical protein
VFQTVNNTIGTMFLVSNDSNVINRAVWGTLRIESRHTDSLGHCSPSCSSFETDNDWLRFVVGYRNGTGDVGSAGQAEHCRERHGFVQLDVARCAARIGGSAP